MGISVHYHVGENTPGCLPEADPAVFQTKAAAQAHARSLAEQLRELGYLVSGNARDGYVACPGRDSPGGNRCVWVQACSDPGCKPEDSD